MHGPIIGNMGECFFDQELCFGSRDQCGRIDPQRQGPELALTNEVRNRLAGKALLQNEVESIGLSR